MSARKVSKTLVFTTLYPSSARPGFGIFVEKRLSELLRSEQVQTRVVAPVPWFFSSHARYGAYARCALTPKKEIYHGVEVLHPRYFVLPKFGMYLAPFTLALGALPAVQQLLDDGFDFDLIDAHYYYPDGVAAALLASYFKKPFVVTARGSDINLLSLYAIPRQLMQWASRRASASIGVSQALAHSMKKMGMPAQGLRTFSNGVDLELFRPQEQVPKRTALNWPSGPTLISVGNLVESKGHHLAIEALVGLPDFRLVIVGEGPLRDSLERLTVHFKLTSRVVFLGQVTPVQLSDCYSAADILVLMSSREGWPNVLLESMACGTPVVATRVGGIPEIVNSPDAGFLLDARTVSELVKSVQTLWHHMPTREAVRACTLVHHWASTTQAQISLFDEVLQTWPRQLAPTTTLFEDAPRPEA